MFMYMESRFVKAAALLAIALIISSCSIFRSSSDKQNTDVVGEVDGNPVTFQELKHNYQRNPVGKDPDGELDIDDFANFLDLYLDYRAKLEAARDAGYFEDESILTELNQYEMQSVYPYWMENRLKDEMLQELYERSLEQIRASHILINVGQQPTPSDTLNAWNRLLEARERFRNGEDFDELSKEYSSSDRGRSMGGDIGYFGAGRTVKEFEDVAYSTPVNEVSLPFRTQFGYHMLYVKERRETVPEKLFSHIYFQAGQNNNSVLERAGEASEKLKAGEDWTIVVHEYSEDQSSVPRAGQIGWIQQGQYAAKFDSTIMSLKAPGDITEPFQSEYGVHIVKLDSVKTYENDEQRKAELEDLLKNLPRYRNARGTTLDRVKDAGNAQVHQDNLEIISKKVSGSPGVSFENLDWQDNFRSMPVYSINGSTYSVGDYFEWLETKWEQSQTRVYAHDFTDQFIDEKTENHVLEITKREFPEFARLSDQYLDGLVVFKITEDSVWNYASTDTASLKELYQSDSQRYWYEKRFEYYRFSAAHDTTIQKGVDMYKSGMPVDSISGNIQGLTIRRDMVTNLDEHPVSLLADLEEGEFTEVFAHRARRNRLLLETVHEPRQMEFEEAFHRLVSDYQPIREKEWLQNIRQTYRVKPYPEKLREIATVQS
jgi:peptidyl-prolyl cis-trans isomerase SurA